MHYLLEILDYETKDLSFVTDKKEVKYLNNILNHELFKNVKKPLGFAPRGVFFCG